MFDYFTELMLRAYFTIDVTVGRFISDKSALFALLTRIFLLPKEEADRLFALTEREEVKSIVSEREYHRHRRMKQYFEMEGRERNADAALDELIDLKGASLTMAMNYQFLHDAQDVRTVACENLTRAAECGLVPAMCLVGILQSEGYVFEKNATRGLAMIRMAADWNNEEGLLTALYYDETHRAYYLSRLYERLLSTGHHKSFAPVDAAYDYQGPKGKREFRLLEKAIAQGILKREMYVKSYARLLYSEILEEKDKESLMLTPNKDLFAEANALPLKLSSITCTCDVTELAKIQPRRVAEQRRIALQLNNIDLRSHTTYRPLCIVSDSRYLLNVYADAIADCLKGAHVERIEVDDLGEYDLEPTKSNIFVRSSDEDVFNAYFLFFYGQISERAYNTAENFLQSANRSRFRLNRPSVTLNLSMILPICFCDREHARQLQPYCDVVRIEDLTKDEKAGLVRSILTTKSSAYGIIGKITVQESVCAKLAEYSVDDIERILDRAVREHREGVLELTEELMQPYFKEMGSRHGTYGFGGSIHE